jgi:hypothetical protein
MDDEYGLSRLRTDSLGVPDYRVGVKRCGS